MSFTPPTTRAWAGGAGGAARPPRGKDLARALASGLTALAVAAGAASVLARRVLAPAVLEPAQGLSLAAPWIACGVAVMVGALVLRAHRARLRRAAAHGPARTPGEVGPLVGPDVATLALGPVAAGVGTWFAVACGLPLCATGTPGAIGVETVQVVQRPAPGLLACPYRLVLAGGSLPQPVEACVDREAWTRGAPGHAATIEVVRGPLALEVRTVDPSR